MSVSLLFIAIWNLSMRNVLFFYFILIFLVTAVSASTALLYFFTFLAVNNTVEIRMCVSHIYHNTTKYLSKMLVWNDNFVKDKASVVIRKNSSIERHCKGIWGRRRIFHSCIHFNLKLFYYVISYALKLKQAQHKLLKWYRYLGKGRKRKQ